MNRHISKIIDDTKDIKNQTWAWYQEQTRWKRIGIAFGVVIVLALIIMVVSGEEIQKESVEKAPRAVTVAPVSLLANKDSELPLLGTVTSVNEAVIRAETSGKLTRVYKKLGDQVVAGQIIAEFENSSERASVLQAEGAYDAAKAARDIARINSGTTNQSLGDTKSNALNALGSAYIAMDDVVRVKTDGAFSNPRNSNIKLAILVPDSILVSTLERKREAIETLLVNRDARNRTLSVNSDLLSELNTVQSELQTIKTYLDDLATAYAKAVPDTSYSQSALDSGKTSVGVARTTIASTITSVTASRTALNASLAASDIADKTVGAEGSTSVATADAQVKQALGAYNAALSRLEKTIVRSPISGTLNSLTIETGDFISAFTEVGVVSNNGALEVLSYVTEEDAKRITVGVEVSIDNKAKGVITRIAGALDPRTKKIEVRIGIKEGLDQLTNGQSVRVVITKNVQTITSTSGPIKIPLSALKLTPQGAFVFLVSATSSLASIPVTEGAILGEDIQIISGLTGEESIVVDARGLKEGMTVTVQE